MSSPPPTPNLNVESDDLLKEALNSGIDLNTYLKNINEEISTVESSTINDSLNQISKLNNLYENLQSTDETLAQLEDVLATFQESLGSISSEIQHLQETSLDISIKLKNRQELHQDVCQFVDELHVSEGMIATIMNAQVTDQDFIECLHELRDTFLEQKKGAPRWTKSR